MSRKIFVWPLITIFLGGVLSAEAQQLARIPRIGFLSAYSPGADGDRIDAFRQGLRDLGYFEEKNFRIDYRHTEGKRERLSSLSAELVALQVNVIVAGGGSNLVRIIKQATTSIPIIMTGGSDPVAAGLISSLARPGGNVTGLTSLTLDLSGKRLELLKEALPKLFHVAVLYDVGNPAKIIEFKETQKAARDLGVEIQSLDVRSTNEFVTAFKSAVSAQVGALITLQSPLTVTHRKRIADLALKARLPMILAESGLLESGGLMSYGPDYADLYRRAATYVDRILKGAKAADLPVEQPTKFELVINLQTARQIGLTIPPNVLARADKVIR